jgi:glycosyltransferase involved in cell wall biosynthesis
MMTLAECIYTLRGLRRNLTRDVSPSRKNVTARSAVSPPENRFRVLLVPDWEFWVLGTIAKGIARANPWMDATIVSGPILDELYARDSAFFDRFDLVHFICPYASKKWIGVLSSHVPVVTSHHHVTEWPAVSHNIEADAVIAGSTQWARDLVERGADDQRVFTVPYGVDTNLFAPASADQKSATRSRLGFAQDAPVVGFFAKRGSNDDDRKGIDVFSAAVRALHRELNDAAVLIVGPGWREMVDDLKAAGVPCMWIPFVTEMADVAVLYRALDFYWVTARVEGGPVPLLEAMSSGLCALTTRVGLANDVVIDGVNAVFIAMNDSAAFARETVRLWNDKPRRAAMGAEARKSMVEVMHDQKTLQGVREVYERAIAVFSTRTGKKLAPIPISVRKPAIVANQSEWRSGLTDSERRLVKSREALSWSQHLMIYEGQRPAAFKLMMRAWMLQPFSVTPVRTMLRLLLPQRMVRGIVTVKRQFSAP